MKTAAPAALAALGALFLSAAPALADGCATARFAVTPAEATAITIRDTREGWSWTSPALGGPLVAHDHAGAACTATVADLDGDGSPEVIVTAQDGAESGLVHAFTRKPGEPAFTPLPCEVGPGLKPRDFLVWDIPARTAPVSVKPDGAIVVTGREFSLLGAGVGRAEYTWKLIGGLLRHTGTKSSSDAHAAAR
jgi:hypothetical protein